MIICLYTNEQTDIFLPIHNLPSTMHDQSSNFKTTAKYLIGIPFRNSHLSSEHDYIVAITLKIEAVTLCLIFSYLLKFPVLLQRLSE